MEALIIGLGGACGALLRYYIVVATISRRTTEFALGTFLANIVGCFLIGVLIGSGCDQQYKVLRLGFGVGFLGSLTTFSTFSAETIAHLANGNWPMAAFNMFANLVVCLLATAAGIALGQRLFN